MIKGERESFQPPPDSGGSDSAALDERASLFVERFRERAPSILADFFIAQGIDNYRIEEVNATRKSIYGGVEIEGKRYFYKISVPEKILMELQGYRLASEYPHERVISHSFNDEYGIYLQDFCPDIDKDRGLLMTESNLILLSGESGEQDAHLTKTREIFKRLGGLYEGTLIRSPMVLRGQNDAFFHDRAQSGGRIDQLYRGREIPLPSAAESIDFDELSQFSLTVNGEKSEANLAELIAKARIQLSPEQKRYFVLSQGDPTERNVSINGTFFDFEVAGLNSFIQDVAIFACYNYFSGHYITPRYSTIDEASEPADIKKFAEGVSVHYSIDNGKKEINISTTFQHPRLKAEMLRQYIEEVVKRVERCIPEADGEQLVSQLQSAILLRIMGVKNLLRFEEKDLVLSLGLAGHFSGTTTKAKTVSQFLEEKFRSLPSN